MLHAAITSILIPLHSEDGKSVRRAPSKPVKDQAELDKRSIYAKGFNKEKLTIEYVQVREIASAFDFKQHSLTVFFSFLFSRIGSSRLAARQRASRFAESLHPRSSRV